MEIENKQNSRIYLASPHMSCYVQEYINEAFRTNLIAPLGTNVDGFEKEMCDYTGAKNAVALSSGTAAIHLGLKYLGVGKQDPVICPSLTFSASANPIMYLDAEPVFVDCDYTSWNMDPDALETALERYPGTKAIIGVNLYGQSSDYDAICEIASARGIPILEDAAESLGATYKGKQTGLLGDIGIYSFNGNKIITTSGGGMLVAEEKAVADKIRFWSTQSRENYPYYQHEEIGYNYRMSNITAGIGRGQLKVLALRVSQKKHIYEYYKEAFSDIDEIGLMPVAEFGEPNFWLSCILLHEDSRITPNEIIDVLEVENIEARRIWKPMHLQPVFGSYAFISVKAGEPVCEDIFKRGVCLPSDTKLSGEDLGRIAGIIRKLFGK
ncbi:MAG: aminotransferase class I/II-fold pyridoxal phosphate-dependent enzyme [Clostridia bacterium]